MQLAPVWTPPRVVRRDQPLGNRGSYVSLEEVAQKATEGRLDPLIVAWARRCIQDARPSSQAEHAACLLDAQRKAVVYVPDPVHAEHIQAARITLAYSQGGDCDDVTTLYLAACMAIGLRCQLASHGYSQDDTLEHVLARVYCDGQWYYADPSVPGLPFGRLAKDKTWERLLDLPVVPGKKPRVLCNATSCDLSPAGLASPSPMQHSGDFVGVGSVPSPSARLHPLLVRAMGARKPAGLGGLFDVQGPDAMGEIAQARADLALTWDQLITTHEQAVQDAAAAGLAFPDPGLGGPLGWTAADEARFGLLSDVHQTLSGGLAEALSGARKLVQDTASNLLGLAAADSDLVTFSTDPAGAPVLTSKATGQSISLDTGSVVCAPGFRSNPAFTPQNAEPACVPVPAGQAGVGGWQVVVGVVAGVLAFVAVIYAVIEVMRQDTEQARIAANRARDEHRSELLKQGITTPEQENAYDQSVVAKTEAEAKIAQAKSPSNYADLVKNAAILVAVGVGAYVVYRLVSPSSSSSPGGPRIEIVNETRREAPRLATHSTHPSRVTLPPMAKSTKPVKAARALAPPAPPAALAAPRKAPFTRWENDFYRGALAGVAGPGAEMDPKHLRQQWKKSVDPREAAIAFVAGLGRVETVPALPPPPMALPEGRAENPLPEEPRAENPLPEARADNPREDNPVPQPHPETAFRTWHEQASHLGGYGMPHEPAHAAWMKGLSPAEHVLETRRSNPRPESAASRERREEEREHRRGGMREPPGQEAWERAHERRSNPRPLSAADAARYKEGLEEGRALYESNGQQFDADVPRWAMNEILQERELVSPRGRMVFEEGIRDGYFGSWPRRRRNPVEGAPRTENPRASVLEPRDERRSNPRPLSAADAARYKEGLEEGRALYESNGQQFDADVPRWAMNEILQERELVSPRGRMVFEEGIRDGYFGSWPRRRRNPVEGAPRTENPRASVLEPRDERGPFWHDPHDASPREQNPRAFVEEPRRLRGPGKGQFRPLRSGEGRERARPSNGPFEHEPRQERGPARGSFRKSNPLGAEEAYGMGYAMGLEDGMTAEADGRVLRQPVETDPLFLASLASLEAELSEGDLAEFLEGYRSGAVMGLGDLDSMISDLGGRPRESNPAGHEDWAVPSDARQERF